MKTCDKCLTLKSLDKFYFIKKRQKYENRCLSCRREYQREYERNYYKINVDKLRARQKKWREKSKDKKKLFDKEYYLKNRDKFLERAKKYYDPLKKKDYDRSYRKNNIGKVRYWRKSYKLAQIKAMPKWITEDMIKRIQEIYHDCPTGHHVDHIIPLRGKIVCGLHVPWNLQYLPASENISKGNKLCF